MLCMNWEGVWGLFASVAVSGIVGELEGSGFADGTDQLRHTARTPHLQSQPAGLL